MSADAFDSSYEKLLESLDEAVSLLREYSEERWAAWLTSDRERIAGGDRYALEHLLTAFGGMGSFNDLVLQRPGVTKGFTAEVRSANERLYDLRHAIWQAATDMKAELRRE